jgi:hypothetical protein
MLPPPPLPVADGRELVQGRGTHADLGSKRLAAAPALTKVEGPLALSAGISRAPQ